MSHRHTTSVNRVCGLTAIMPVGSGTLLARPVQGSKIVLGVRARRGNVMTYDNNTSSHQTTRTLGTRATNRKAAAGLPEVSCGARSGCSQLRSGGNAGRALLARHINRCVQRERRNERTHQPQPVGAEMKCPKCGYEIEVQQNRAAKSRWSRMTAKERAAEMSRIRRKGIKKPKRSARRANAKLSDSASTTQDSNRSPKI